MPLSSFTWSRQVYLFILRAPRFIVFQAIALFNANRVGEAIMRVEELSARRDGVDPLLCGVVMVSFLFAITLMFVR